MLDPVAKNNGLCVNKTKTIKLNSVALVRTRTIPTERPPPSAKLVPTFADREVSRGQRNGSPQPLISVF